MNLSALFDHAVELAPNAREAWLLNLEITAPEEARVLRRLLDSDSATPADKVDANFAALATFSIGMGTLKQPLIDGFRLLRPLGHGGMGEVWLAERNAGNALQRVALKLLRYEFAGADNETQRRFLDEQRIIATLDHPYVARLIDAGRSAEGLPWIAIEYVDGAPVREWCNTQRMSVPARIQLFLKILQAAHHAHQNLIVHRDIKSGNVLVNAQGTPKLLDFGIAKNLSNKEQTATAQRFFSLGAVAPEQLLGGRITVSTDIYQLGILLYELLCGGTPYRLDGPSPKDIQEEILQRTPVLPSLQVCDQAAAERSLDRASQLSRVLNGDLDRIVLHALRKLPAERYQSAIEFAQDLEAFLDGRPVLAVGQGQWYRINKFLWRNWLPVSGVSFATLALALSFAQLIRNDSALKTANKAAQQAQNRAADERDNAREINNLLLDLFRSADPSQQGKNDLRQIVLHALNLELDRGGFLTDPGAAFALIEAAIGLGESARAANLVAVLVANKAAMTAQNRRTLLLLQARIATLDGSSSAMEAIINELAPQMQGASADQRVMYLGYVCQQLIDSQPERVVQLTELEPLPAPLIRLRARALSKVARDADATVLLEAAKSRTDLSMVERLAVLQGLASNYLARGRGEQASPVSAQMYDLAMATFGAENLRLMPYGNTHGLVLSANGRFEQAIKVFDGLLKMPGLNANFQLLLELNRVETGSLMPVIDADTIAIAERLWRAHARMSTSNQATLLLVKLRIYHANGDRASAQALLRNLPASRWPTSGKAAEQLRLWHLLLKRPELLGPAAISATAIKPTAIKPTAISATIASLAVHPEQKGAIAKSSSAVIAGGDWHQMQALQFGFGRKRAPE